MEAEDEDEPKDKTPNRTQIIKMSSSLKDRLKRQGRYHRTPSPFSIRKAAVKYEDQTLGHGEGASLEPRSESTPTAVKRTFSSVSLLKRRLVSNENSSLCARSQQVIASQNQRTIVETLLGNELHDSTVTKSAISSAETPTKSLDSNADSSDNPMKALKNEEHCQKQSEPSASADIGSGPKCSVGGTKSRQELENELKYWRDKVKEKEELLRKMKLMKAHNAKNDLSCLDDLVKKWRQACQDALTELMEKLPDANCSLKHVIDHFQIPYELIRYDVDEESFY